jgi:hypothetical protein
MTTTTLQGYLNLTRVLTFNYVGFGQRSLSGRRFGLRLRGGADSSVGGAASSSATAAEGSSPYQDRPVDFLQSTQAGCQSSTTTTSSTTREDLTITSLTGPSSQSGCRGCWRCPPVQPRRAPPPVPPWMLPPPQQQRRVPYSPAQQGLALHLGQELFDSRGWAATPSGLPHCVPLAFIALINGLRRRQLLQARKLSRQHINSRHEYSTISVKTAYLLRCGLSDLQFFRHALPGHIARPPGGAARLASRLAGRS